MRGSLRLPSFLPPQAGSPGSARGSASEQGGSWTAGWWGRPCPPLVQPWPPGLCVCCSQLLPILGLSDLWSGCLFSPECVSSTSTTRAVNTSLPIKCWLSISACRPYVLASVDTVVDHKLWPPRGKDHVCEGHVEQFCFVFFKPLIMKMILLWELEHEGKGTHGRRPPFPQPWNCKVWSRPQGSEGPGLLTLALPPSLLQGAWRSYYLSHFRAVNCFSSDSHEEGKWVRHSCCRSCSQERTPWEEQWPSSFECPVRMSKAAGDPALLWNDPPSQKSSVREAIHKLPQPGVKMACWLLCCF